MGCGEAVHSLFNLVETQSPCVARIPPMLDLLFNISEVDRVHLSVVEVACSGLVERLRGVLEP